MNVVGKGLDNYDYGAPGILFRCFELAQLTEGGLGRSKPATNLIKSRKHSNTCVEDSTVLYSSLTEQPSIEIK
jgi:hypothetical protein